MVRHRTAAQVSLPISYWALLEEMERKSMVKDRSAAVKEAIELLAQKHGMMLQIEKDEEPIERRTAKAK